MFPGNINIVIWRGDCQENQWDDVLLEWTAEKLLDLLWSVPSPSRLIILVFISQSVD